MSDPGPRPFERTISADLVRRLIRDVAPSPPPRVLLVRRLARAGAAPWFWDVLEGALERIAGAGPGAGASNLPHAIPLRSRPSEPPASDVLIAAKEEGKRRLGSATTSDEVEQAAAIYFGAVALYEGSAGNRTAPPASSLPPSDLEEVYFALYDALDAEWAPVLDRALSRLAGQG